MLKIRNEINKLSEKEILDLVEDKDPRVVVNKYKRCKIIKIIYSILGYDLTPEILYMLLTEPLSKLVVATAGSGKTTNAHVGIVCEKIFRVTDEKKPLDGGKILCLVYNNANVRDMKDKQIEIVNKLYRGGITGVTLDREVNAKTMHSFCKEWVIQYSGKLGLAGMTYLEPDDVNKRFHLIIRAVCKKYQIEEKELNHNKIISLYNLLNETLTDINDVESLKGFSETKASKEMIMDIFRGYENQKKANNKYDFTDMLVKFVHLLRTDESVRTFIQDYYQYIVADEVQDFTPIMIEILYWVSGGRTPILAIGDEDQCIYGFRGSNIKTILEFHKKFPEAIVTSLGTNRRCASNILDTAEAIISNNTQRFDKEIRSIREGGNIEFIPYSTQQGQIVKVIKSLKAMTDDELEDTVVCYRDRKSSVRLTDLLEQEDIPFNLLSGESPFSHELYTHVTNVLDCLFYSYDKLYHRFLYKVLPMSQKEINNVIGYDEKKRRFKTDERCQWIDYSYDGRTNNPNFVALVTRLYEISESMNTKPMNEYFEEVFNYIRKYFWNYKKEINKTMELDNYFEQRVKELFMSDLTYEEFLVEYNSRKEVCARNQYSHTGVTVSTFHSLKGLEYKNVIIIDLEDSLFPNYAFLEKQVTDAEQLRDDKESEVRLFFVAVTRAKDNLTFYYQENNPSLYVKWLLDAREEKSQKVKNGETSILDAFNTTGVVASTVSNNSYEDSSDSSIELEIEDMIEDDEEIYSSSLESMIEENIKEDTVNNSDTESKEDDFLASIRNADFSEDEDNEIKTSITDSEDETDSILDAFKPDNFLSSVLRGL